MPAQLLEAKWYRGLGLELRQVSKFGIFVPVRFRIARTSDFYNGIWYNNARMDDWLGDPLMFVKEGSLSYKHTKRGDEIVPETVGASSIC